MTTMAIRAAGITSRLPAPLGREQAGDRSAAERAAGPDANARAAALRRARAGGSMPAPPAPPPTRPARARARPRGPPPDRRPGCR